MLKLCDFGFAGSLGGHAYLDYVAHLCDRVRIYVMVKLIDRL